MHQVSTRYLKDPVVIQSQAEDGSEPDIDHVVYEVWGGDKFGALRNLLDEQTAGATLVFCRTKRGVRNLCAKLGRLGYPVDQLQDDLAQSYFDRPPLIKRPRKRVVHRGPTEVEARARRLQELGLSPEAPREDQAPGPGGQTAP